MKLKNLTFKVDYIVYLNGKFLGTFIYNQIIKSENLNIKHTQYICM